MLMAISANAHFEKLGTGYFGTELATVSVRTELVPSLDVAVKMSHKLSHAKLLMKNAAILDSLNTAAMAEEDSTTCDHVLVESQARLTGNIKKAKWIKHHLQPKRNRGPRSIMDFFSVLFGLFNRHKISAVEDQADETQRRQQKLIGALEHTVEYQKHMLEELQDHLGKLLTVQRCHKVAHTVDALSHELEAEIRMVDEVMDHRMPLGIMHNMTDQLTDFSNQVENEGWKFAAPIIQMLKQMPTSFIITNNDLIIQTRLPVRNTKGWQGFTIYKLTNPTYKFTDKFVSVNSNQATNLQSWQSSMSR